MSSSMQLFDSPVIKIYIFIIYYVENKQNKVGYRDLIFFLFNNMNKI